MIFLECSSDVYSDKSALLYIRLLADSSTISLQHVLPIEERAGGGHSAEIG